MKLKQENKGIIYNIFLLDLLLLSFLIILLFCWTWCISQRNTVIQNNDTKERNFVTIVLKTNSDIKHQYLVNSTPQHSIG